MLPEIDISRYDWEKESPCRAWQLGLLSPIIPIGFMKLRWYYGLKLWCERSSEYSIREISSRRLNLAIGDVSPYSCILSPQGRFLPPSKRYRRWSHMARTSCSKKETRISTLWIMMMWWSPCYMLDGTSQATLGLCSRTNPTSECVFYLRSML